MPKIRPPSEKAYSRTPYKNKSLPASSSTAKNSFTIFEDDDDHSDPPHLAPTRLPHLKSKFLPQDTALSKAPRVNSKHNVISKDQHASRQPLSRLHHNSHRAHQGLEAKHSKHTENGGSQVALKADKSKEVENVNWESWMDELEVDVPWKEGETMQPKGPYCEELKGSVYICGIARAPLKWRSAALNVRRTKDSLQENKAHKRFVAPLMEL